MSFSPNYKVTQSVLSHLTGIENIKEAFKGSTKFEEVSSVQIVQYLGMFQQSARLLANRWIAAEFLKLSNSSKKARKYRLSGQYEKIAVMKD